MGSNRAYSVLTPIEARPFQSEDFLCGMSSALSFLSGCLAHFLSSDICQVVILIIRFMVSPHHKDDFKPLCSQSSKGLGMTMPLGTLISIVMVRPLTVIERDKSQPIRGMAHHLVTRKTKVHDMALATGFGHRDHSCLSLKVPKRLPAILSITELSRSEEHTSELQ